MRRVLKRKSRGRAETGLSNRPGANGGPTAALPTSGIAARLEEVTALLNRIDEMILES